MADDSIHLRLPGFDACFQNWLDAQTDDDLRQAMSEDVGDLIRGRVMEEIGRRGIGARIIPFSPLS